MMQAQRYVVSANKSIPMQWNETQTAGSIGTQASVRQGKRWAMTEVRPICRDVYGNERRFQPERLVYAPEESGSPGR